MKEHIEYISDCFTDYKGEVHNFVIVAVSQTLPETSGELQDNPIDEIDREIYHEVSLIIDNYGTHDYLGLVNKVLLLGISICNPSDDFDFEIGYRKALHRAYNSQPVIYASNPGVINSQMVKALLSQEARYLKENPENFINGYAESRDRYLNNIEMEKLEKGFSNLERQVVTEIKNNPKFLDKIKQYLNWFNNQRKGNAKNN